MSALVFGSERANAMVAHWKRYDAMTDEEKVKHSPKAIEQELKSVRSRIEGLEYDLATLKDVQAALRAEYATWCLP